MCQSPAVLDHYTASVQGLTSLLFSSTSQAGAPGSGKTTFIHNLAALYGRQDHLGEASPATQQLPPLHSSGARGLTESFTTKPTTLQDFETDPNSLCTRVLFTDEAAKTNYSLIIQAGPLSMQK